MFSPGAATQPDKLQFEGARRNSTPYYWTQVRPILAAMNMTFGNYFVALGALQEDVAPLAAGLFQELVSRNGELLGFD